MKHEAAAEAIYFRESAARPDEFLEELSDPDGLRPSELGPTVQQQLRGLQVSKLEKNIRTLREKQADFNRKIDDYVANLEKLIESLNAQFPRPDPSAKSETLGTVVRCPRCETERTFEDIHVLVAREGQELFSPTVLFVEQSGEFKKGQFACRQCGGESLMIRTR